MPRPLPPISGCRKRLHLPRRIVARGAAEAQGRRQAPQPQKNYALLSDGQIAGIKDRLKLSASQESYWPPVENALRAVARKISRGPPGQPECSGRAD